MPDTGFLLDTLLLEHHPVFQESIYGIFTSHNIYILYKKGVLSEEHEVWR